MPTTPTPSVSEQDRAPEQLLRHRYAAELQDSIREFLDRANLADVVVLNDVMRDWRSLHDVGGTQSCLGEIFAEAVGKRVIPCK